MGLLFGLIAILLQIYFFVLIVYVVLSYVPRPPEPLLPAVRGVRAVVDPVLQPLRRRIPPLRLGGAALDVSIILLIIVVQILGGVAASIAAGAGA